ncbi:3 beta-hydroxysteroid dehydrogenase/Delta 5--4-isomerase [Frankliniella fusca]|uniref:3 beta-hydroxysteroid dehydrogenase/Delta 5--4-isomerase n=1 Tax=Frankliniella fusca TaxID=407009 RepID=A0AAE1LDS6_9NEOP|nr:3 beta-hydroxysteroid dehydrogenase/Delta 5--4-isomerase [Frankliniella fusca]
MQPDKEVVVVTGGSGFLGQHVVKHFREEADVAEVRVVDLRPFEERLGSSEAARRVPVTWVRADLADEADEAACEEAFRGADLVIHCAGLEDRSYPADLHALHRNNVQATEAVVALCRRAGVPRLVFSSSVEVVLVPYLRNALGTALGSYSVIVNQTEARAQPPADPDDLQPFAASKLRAERVVLAANGSPLDDGGSLRTVALRAPVMYGEEDRRLVPGLLRLARLFDNTLLQLGGPCQRHQHAYVGNVAWAHVCAGRALRRDQLAAEDEDAAVVEAQAVAGLAVFVTDESPRGDLLRLAQLLLTFPDVSGSGARPLVRVRAPPLLPTWLSYLAARAAEALLTAATGARLPVRPSALISYLASFVSLSRLRAETRLCYAPKYPAEDAIARSRAYYARAKDLLEDDLLG